MRKGLISLGGFAAAAALFVAFNVLAGVALRPVRVDLTDGKLYTLSEGSRRVTRGLEEPVRLTLYYSEKLGASLPAQIRTYATRVREVLGEYARASGGKVIVETVNPEPFSDAEDRAVQAGLVGVPTGTTGQDRFYFGLVGTNAVDRQEVIPFLRPDREEYLEYELTRMIYLLSEPAKKAVGLMTWLPIEGAFNPMAQQPGQQQTPAWQVVRQMKDLFDVRTLDRSVTEIPEDIKVLMLVHPKNVSESTLYAIDQFVLRGGRLLVFVDPHCENDVPPGINPMQALSLPKNSELTKLMDAWGVEMAPGVFAADRSAAPRVNVGTAQRPEVVSYVAWAFLDGDRLERSDPVTGPLRSVNFATAGVLRKKEGVEGGLEMTPLVRTGTDSAALDVQKVQFVPDPKSLLADFVPAGRELVLAARLTGKARSAFDGPPGSSSDGGEYGEEGGAGEADASKHIAESAEPVNIVVVADCDMLADRFWVQEERLGPIILGLSKIADNGDFVIGLLDNLSGSNDLLSLRARGRHSRPFEKVREIRQAAEARYLAKEQELQNRLRETENKINELQRQRADGQSEGAVLLTPEQQAEIEKFRQEMVATRKELREVQHSLRRDIDRLGTKLRFLNIGLMPALVGVAAVGVGAWRAGRRKADRRNRTALS